MCEPLHVVPSLDAEKHFGLVLVAGTSGLRLCIVKKKYFQENYKFIRCLQ